MPLPAFQRLVVEQPQEAREAERGQQPQAWNQLVQVVEEEQQERH